MTAFTYNYPEDIREILRDAKPVETGRYGMSWEGHMALFRGRAGSFVVHTRAAREVTPQVRVLKVPDGVSDSDAVVYARENPQMFTPWQDMILEG